MVIVVMLTAHGDCFTAVCARPFSPLHRSKFKSMLKKQKTCDAVASINPSRIVLSTRGGETLGLYMSSLSPTAASIIAGSIAGAIGVGVAFPLDTLKTKSQVLGQAQSGGSIAATRSSNDTNKIGMFALIKLIYAAEGISGFFGGVRGMMVGQAFIKAVAFGSNKWMLDVVNDAFPHSQTFLTLFVAATFSGFVTSFLVAPFERVKVMMQASDNYANEFQTIKVILNTEGWEGLLTRGLGPTLAREIPSYGIYFVTYGLLMQTTLTTIFGSYTPLIAGAAAGCACWVPVYPIDVVKTLIQNTAGDGENDSFKMMRELYEKEGIGGFFDGLTPKMYRAMVNHATTFWIFDLIMESFKNSKLII